MWRISNTSVDSLSICLLNYIFFFFLLFVGRGREKVQGTVAKAEIRAG